MRCGKCDQQMVPMLFSMVCDYCDGLKSSPAPFVGYVVWHEDFTFPGRAYVFSRPEHARQWLEWRGPQGAEVRRVQSYVMFNWRNGVQITASLEFSDTLQYVHATPSHPHTSGHVHLWSQP